MEEHYYGSGRAPQEYELRALGIDAMHREDEAALVQSRWFDYSQLHPAQATYLYAALYKAQTLLFAEAFIDIRTAEDARAFVPDDIYLSRDATAMWLARRAADALGMPYEFALQFAQARALNRLFQQFPRPNQLYGEEFEIDLAAAWGEHKARSLCYSRLPRYQAASFSSGSVMQKRHTASVIAQISERPHAAHPGLLARMFSEGVLAPRLAESHFPEAVIVCALKVAKGLDGQS